MVYHKWLELSHMNCAGYLQSHHFRLWQLPGSAVALIALSVAETSMWGT